MSCTQTEKISLLIDGELSAAEMRETERHLLECSECQLAHADFLGLRTQVGTYSPMLEPTAPKGALARILSGTERPAREHRSWLQETFAALTLNRAATAFAALLLVAFGVVTFVFVRSQWSNGEIAKDVSPSPAETATPDSTAENRGKRKTTKDVRNGPPAPSRKTNLPGKPARERSSPKPPEPRTLAPPNYAGVTQPANSSEKQIASTGPADTETLTLRHLEQSELLLRGFRNVRLARNRMGPDVDYERKRAQELIYQNMLLRREAESSGDVHVATLLGSLEPILLDIANLRSKPQAEEVRTIKDRMERQSLVALLQVSSASAARANE